MRRIYKFFASFSVLALAAPLAAVPFRVFAATLSPVDISSSLPGMPANATSSPGAFIAGFYQFSLMISGLLAFGVVVYGGVKYMTAAGNPSGQSEGKEWIQSALLGLLLLGGAYFILQLINPALLNLNLPNLQPVSVDAGTNTQALTPASSHPTTTFMAPVSDHSPTVTCAGSGAVCPPPHYCGYAGTTPGWEACF